MHRGALILALAALAASGARAADLANGCLRLSVRGASVTGLRADPAGKGRTSLEFARSLRPEDWEETPETRVMVSGRSATVAPLRVWHRQHIDIVQQGNAYPALLQPGGTLTQTFRIPEATVFSSVTVRMPTWHAKDSAATLALYRDGVRLAQRRLVNIPDNSAQTLPVPGLPGAGTYTLTLSDPKGMVGWWSMPDDRYAGGEAQADGAAVPGDRTLLVDSRRDVGPGTLRYTLDGPALRVEGAFPTRGEKPVGVVPWRWKTSWTKAGYDCTPRAGVVFSRFFTDNQRYMPVQQLKRRAEAGLSFDGARWIEMEGNRDADLRLSGAGLHLHWEMAPREMSLRFDTPVQAAGGAWKTAWTLAVLPRHDSVPASFPRFALPDRKLTEDVNRLWWERGFTYPGPAGPAAWFDWTSRMRAWFAGPQRDGEMGQIRGYPLTPEGYVHTWGQSVGWPFPASPPYDTRHFDTNARFILGCRHFWLWTGDGAFLRSQADRLRSAMRYQLDTLRGREGLIVSVSKDVNGRHKGVGNNYWDILPFGHLDAYANAVFYASLEAMDQMQRALGEKPLADYAALRRRVHARYDATFWDAAKGRYIGCVDIDGKRHDYGFTFVNMEALAYGLGDTAKARRIYRWMETEPTSTGKPDTYSRWIFAPRANTIHNPPWKPEEKTTPAPVLTTLDSRLSTPPWWHFGWLGTPYGEQCQDGGAILYTSYFDLMARLRHRGPEDAWRRFMAIIGRYRLPDRLCGGPPLYRGEIPQQENPGAVGVDLPFPESGLVPLWLLYGAMGVEATPTGLRVAPRLPKALPFAEVRGVHWRGATLRVRVTNRTVDVWGERGGRRFHRTFRLRPGGVVVWNGR